MGAAPRCASDCGARSLPYADAIWGRASRALNCGQVELCSVQGRFEGILRHGERARIERPSDKPGRIARLPRPPPMLADARDEEFEKRKTEGGVILPTGCERRMTKEDPRWASRPLQPI